MECWTECWSEERWSAVTILQHSSWTAVLKESFFLGVVCELRAAIDAELLIEWSRRTETTFPLLSPGFLAIFPPLWLSLIVSFRTHDDGRPSKFIVLADNMRAAIKIAWEHGGADFQSRFDKSTGQAQEMKEGALRIP